MAGATGRARSLEEAHRRTASRDTRRAVSPWAGDGVAPMTRTSRPHDEAAIEMLREDPAFADEYLTASMAAVDEPGGREALLAALRQVAEAQRARRGLSREGES